MEEIWNKLDDDNKEEPPKSFLHRTNAACVSRVPKLGPCLARQLCSEGLVLNDLQGPKFDAAYAALES